MGYFEGGDYKRIPADYDILNVVVCQIRIWKAEAPNWFEDKKGVYFTEAESIEIHQSYSNIISTATIKMPRGAVLAKAITKDGDNKTIKAGNGSKDSVETQLKDQTQSGQLIADGSSIDTGGIPTLSVETQRDDAGNTSITHKEDRLVTVDDIAIGNRIEIKMGYVVDELPNGESVEEKIKKLRNGEEVLGVNLVFSGFITACSPSSPLIIECEDMASLLKKKGCPVVLPNKDYKVKDFLLSKGEGGVFDILNGTGLVCSEITKKSDISVGKVEINKNNTISDLLSDWVNNLGLAMFMEPDGKSIRVARRLYTGEEIESNVNYINYSDGAPAEFIQFDWDVANDNLSVSQIDPNFVVVVASGFDKDKKPLKVTVRKPENVDTNGQTQWDYINEHQPSAKKTKKRRGGQTRQRLSIKKSNYVILKHEVAHAVTMDELKESARNFWKANAQNGIKGSITIFGDRNITPGKVVCLIDPRQPEKQGYYIVESVTIRFGADVGYKKELTIPYRLKGYDKPIKYIT